MNIQVGVGSFKELEFFLKEGAREFYCGLSYIPSHVEGTSNFKNIYEIIRANHIIKKEKKNFFFTANEIDSSAFKKTIDTILKLHENGIDGFIIKDLSLLEEIKKKNIRPFLILSTLSMCLNSKSALFYKRNYYIKRIALCEQITPEESKKIIKTAETEVFLKHRESCRNFNGLCFLSCHGPKTTPCLKKYNETFTMPGFSREENLRHLYRYYKYGTKILKIGRSPLGELSRVIFFEAKNIIDILKNSKNEEEFLKYSLKFTKEYDKIYKKLSIKYGFIC
ncbi:MAG TPA: U32 family peptidase [Elusimicrobiales bacterium]|nr:U32 family peptidase [Elusimicrobiales bacterium]HOL62793.1 U32 family peptidase [Elusimicrobiales bacterium]HPO95843.1 U32 family peptidase [Elusimicrobiales bacterium]